MQAEARAAIIGAIVSAFFTLAGSYLNAYLADKQREKERSVEQRKATLDQQQKLLERLSVLANSRARGERLRQVLEEDSQLHDDAQKCAESARPNLVKVVACKKMYDPNTTLSAHKEYVQLNSDYASTLQLSRLYFGDTVSKQIDKMNETLRMPGKSWWDVPPAEFQSLLKAMHAETASTRS